MWELNYQNVRLNKLKSAGGNKSGVILTKKNLQDK